MPVELNIVESVTALDTTVVEVILTSASEPGPAGPGVPTGGTAGQVLTKDSGTDYDTSWQDSAGGGGGAPTTVDYLVGTADATLSAEIVVGTSPGGELGGTWASPTVDATHSGSSHAGVQAAAEATAAAALAAHLLADVVDGDAAGGVLSGTYPNPGFAADMATQAELDAHVNDATDAHDASAISILDTANDFTATDVEGALAELQADHETDAQGLADHIADATAAHAASAISVDSTTLVGTGTDAQAVFEELDNGIADHMADATAAHAATAISFTPNGSIAATDVQTAIQEVRDEAGAGSGIPVDGWVDSGETWTYASADDPTFTFTVAGDLTTKYSAGMRVRLVQTTTKYFIVTKVAHAAGTTTVTIYGGTDYDLANAAITSPYWSPVKAPFGFPLAQEKWTVTVTDTTQRTQNTPTQNTWYNLGTVSLAIPIGAWVVDWVATCQMVTPSAGQLEATLSTANNSESDASMTATVYFTSANWASLLAISKALSLTAKTSYFLNTRTTDASISSIHNRGDMTTTTVRAVCAYL